MSDLIEQLRWAANAIDPAVGTIPPRLFRAAADELDRLRRELEKRAKQLGVACDKHDLTHALACGRCLADARREPAEARRDAARLEWVLPFIFAVGAEGDRRAILMAAAMMNGLEGRAAIDAAMAAE